jgi:hypothetical protein
MKRALLLAALSLFLPFATAHATCTASHVCGDGNTATCSGTSTCSVTQAGVSCDGVETKCPNYCSVVDVCTDCNYYLFCWSTAGTCSETDDGITCQPGGTPRHCHCPDTP